VFEECIDSHQRSFLLELKQFNQVARWIFQKPGATRSRLADFSPEFGAGIVQPVNEGVYIFRDDHESVPSTGLGVTAGSPSTACPWSAQVEREIIANERCELARVVHVNLELETIAIKRDRGVNVSHNVPNGCHGPFSTLKRFVVSSSVKQMRNILAIVAHRPPGRERSATGTVPLRVLTGLREHLCGRAALVF
jgi:hypothetical protein